VCTNPAPESTGNRSLRALGWCKLAGLGADSFFGFFLGGIE
jgi:hypothetical protein